MVGPDKFTQDAGAIDTLFGEDARDWFLMTPGDQVQDQQDNETCLTY